MFNNTDERRFMTASYLYIGIRNDGEIVLNDVARIVEGDFEVYNVSWKGCPSILIYCSLI